MLAYTFFAVGSALLAARFLADKTPLRWGSWFLLASSAGCVLTFIGQALGNPILTQGNLAGAALTIPFAIVAILEGRRLMRGGPRAEGPKKPGRTDQSGRIAVSQAGAAHHHLRSWVVGPIGNVRS